MIYYGVIIYYAIRWLWNVSFIDIIHPSFASETGQEKWLHLNLMFFLLPANFERVIKMDNKAEFINVGYILIHSEKASRNS